MVWKCIKKIKLFSRWGLFRDWKKSQYIFKRSFRLCFFSKFLVYWLWKGKIAFRLERPINTPIKGSQQLTRQVREGEEICVWRDAFIMDWTLRPRTFCWDTSQRRSWGHLTCLGMWEAMAHLYSPQVCVLCVSPRLAHFVPLFHPPT